MAPAGGAGAGGANHGKIFSATYSNVPVYEFNVNGNHVMRRRSDDWINATHILKVADLDKPARTRVLEREVQKGVHEKVQGGYGKYQGTWVPLHDGRDLAQRNGVLEKLRPIFDFVPGVESPPQAPKHTTAASNKPKLPKAAVAPRRPMPAPSQMMIEDHYDNMSTHFHDDESLANSPGSVSVEDEDTMGFSQQSTASRKRKRVSNHVPQISIADQQHLMYADELLDYFMLSSTSELGPQFYRPPEPPATFEVDRPIDDKGHTALHWGAAMGDIDVVKSLLARGATKGAMSMETETPLMRAVLFTNNFEKQTMPKLVHLLQDTIDLKDSYGANVFHHIAATTSSLSKLKCARYYSETIINKLSELRSNQDVVRILNTQDIAGDTALHIAARNGARKCVRSFSGHGADSDIPNKKGVTANELIRELTARRAERFHHPSSSPFQPVSQPDLGVGGAVAPPPTSANIHVADSFGSQSEAAHIISSQIGPLITEKTEKLAAAFDKEVEEKNHDLAEAQRLLASIEQERQRVREETYALMASSSSSTTNNADDAPAHDADLARLLRDCHSLVERSQHAALHARVRRHEAACHADDALPPTLTESDLRDKFSLALALRAHQADRATLVRQVVADLAAAGVDDRAADFRRLIASAIGVRAEDVEGFVGDLLEELEGAR